VIHYPSADQLVERLARMTEGVSVFVEAGAYMAEWSQRVALEHPDAHVIALEANPYTHAAYEPDMPEGIDYLHAAAHDHDGVTDFRIMATHNGSHLPQIAGNNSVRERLDDRLEYEIVSVPSIRIDSLLAQRGLTGQPCVMWWDLEGGTDYAIAGAHDALYSCVALMVEVEERRYWRDQALANEVDWMLGHFGLRCVARDSEFPDQHNRIYGR
jgi:FkbM family methyltransferase